MTVTITDGHRRGGPSGRGGTGRRQAGPATEAGIAGREGGQVAAVGAALGREASQRRQPIEREPVAARAPAHVHRPPNHLPFPVPCGSTSPTRPTH
jgi:hypothetical protein